MGDSVTTALRDGVLLPGHDVLLLIRVCGELLDSISAGSVCPPVDNPLAVCQETTAGRPTAGPLRWTQPQLSFRWELKLISESHPQRGATQLSCAPRLELKMHFLIGEMAPKHVPWSFPASVCATAHPLPRGGQHGFLLPGHDVLLLGHVTFIQR